MSGRCDQNRRSTWVAGGLTLLGCVLFLASTWIPVMRWSVNAKHSTPGNARAWLGEGWTLADGGFGGASLLPVSAAAAVALGVVTLVRSGGNRWWFRVALGGAAGYLPLWVAYVFLRKQEDGVDPALGVAVLAVACVCVASGLWLGRPTARNRARVTGPEECIEGAEPAEESDDRSVR